MLRLHFAERLGMILLLLACGCGTFRLSPRYEKAADFRPGDIGHGTPLRLAVSDERRDSTYCGATRDVYEQRIESDRPAVAFVDDAFRATLSAANYVLNESSPITYEVKVRAIVAEWAAEFFSSYQSSVALDVAIWRDGKLLGRKRISEAYTAPKSVSDNYEAAASNLLSYTVSRAAEHAMADPGLTQLIAQGKP